MTLLAALAILVAASLTVMLSRVVTLDDAYITFRYARHLADGYRLGAWNRTGEHVEGYSSLLWMLLLAGAARFGVDVWVASKALGVGAAIAVIATLMVDAVHIDALGLNTPYIARHGTFDPEGPQDSKTDMRWVVEQRPDIIEGYLSGSERAAAR